MKRNAFTFVELVVVIAIIGILIALLVPAIHAARTAVEATKEGKEAYAAGVPYESCPYKDIDKDMQSAKRKCWQEGWKDAAENGYVPEIVEEVPVQPAPTQPNRDRGSPTKKNPNLYRSG